ncbi:uncharacterized protein LOC143920271 [Arctopsyche grandis]|uniref:uncharacterized protein LOC143920271 n=1 Tax=Arctopsyche grandis TaxID=121162 RepID=UPI00406D97AE
MHMSFWWDWDLGDFYIDGVSVRNAASMVFACIFMMILAMIFEGLKVIETKLHHENDMRIRRTTSGRCSDDRNNLLNPDHVQNGAESSVNNRITIMIQSTLQSRYWILIGNVLLFSTNNFIKYLMMLGFMLYNGYLSVSIIIGIAAGYFIFGYIGCMYNIKSVLQSRKPVVVCMPDCENDDGTTPPLIPGASESNIQTCEFEVHNAGSSEGAHNADIEKCQKDKCLSDSSSIEIEPSVYRGFYIDKESTDETCDNEVCSEITALNNYKSVK